MQRDHHNRPSRPSPELVREFNDRGTLWLLEDPLNVRDLLALLDLYFGDLPRYPGSPRHLVKSDFRARANGRPCIGWTGATVRGAGPPLPAAERAAGRSIAGYLSG